MSFRQWFVCNRTTHLPKKENWIWIYTDALCCLQVQEEEMLVAELRKIEMRKKEREKKQQDLQKLITAAENQADSYRLKYAWFAVCLHVLACCGVNHFTSDLYFIYSCRTLPCHRNQLDCPIFVSRSEQDLLTVFCYWHPWHTHTHWEAHHSDARSLLKHLTSRQLYMISNAYFS